MQQVGWAYPVEDAPQRGAVGSEEEELAPEALRLFLRLCVLSIFLFLFVLWGLLKQAGVSNRILSLMLLFIRFGAVG